MRRMWSIPHLSKASATEVRRLLGGGDIQVTEKIDGSNISFGIIDSKVFIKTKKGECVSTPDSFIALAERFPDTVDVQQGFIHTLACLRQREQDLIDFCKKFESVQIFGELLHKPAPNIIDYSKRASVFPAIYIFDVRVNGESSITLMQSKQFKQLLSKLSRSILTSIAPPLPDLNMPQLHLEWAVMQQMHPHLYSRKRLPECLDSKSRSTEALSKWLVGLTSFIRDRYDPAIEGVILRNVMTNQFVKVVDLDLFAKKRALEWSGVSDIKNVRHSLYNRVLHDVFKSADIIIMPDKQNQKVIDACTLVSSVDVVDVLYKDIKNDIGEVDVARAAQHLKESVEQFQELVSKGDRAAACAATEISIVTDIIENFSHSTTSGVKSLIQYMVGNGRLSELEKLVRKV